jgi:hypothetical protein
MLSTEDGWRSLIARQLLLRTRLKRILLALDRKQFNPDQPRHPPGSREGGRWKDGAAGSTPTSSRLPSDRVGEADRSILAQARTPPDVEARCNEQLRDDNRRCDRFTNARVRAACRGQATFRYSACLAQTTIPYMPF